MNQETCMGATAIACDYQAEVDLLYAWIGEPQPAENIEVESGIYVRVARDTRQVVGIEVVDCAARFERHPSTIDAAFARTLLDVFSKPALDRFAATNRPHPSLFSSQQ